MSDLDDLLALVEHDVPSLRRAASTDGGEWTGPCPFCGRGHDRFHVWPHHPSGKAKYWCRKCGRSGDTIAYLVERGDITPTEAARLRRAPDGPLGTPGPAQRPVITPRHTKPLAPPGPAWQRSARAFCRYAVGQLWETPPALAYLRGRGLTDATIRAAGLGWSPKDWRRDPARWGVTTRRKIWLPPGWVIPWVVGGAMWRVNIRRPKRQPKFLGPAGFANALYGADALARGRPAIIVEGEFDALNIGQVAGDLVTPVATGSTSGARRAPWIARLVACSVVLLGFDVDDAGERAARWWAEVLANARRWRPTREDASAMAEGGADVRAWILAGLGEVADVMPGNLDPEAEALALLDRMGTDPDARRRYAELAEQQGWPCGETTWAEWADQVTR